MNSDECHRPLDMDVCLVVGRSLVSGQCRHGLHMAGFARVVGSLAI